jgi:linoleoyl-CoA desaturase
VTPIRYTQSGNIGELPKFAPGSNFWSEVRGLVSEHLASEAAHGRPSIGDPRAISQAAVILIWSAFSYGALLGATSFLGALLAALCFACASAAAGFCIFHDANHGTLFRRPYLNLMTARVCSAVLGPSRHLWVQKHGHHHRQPNVYGWDDDLESRGALRLSPRCAWESRFRRQELKALFFYSVNTIEWLFWKDFHCLATGRLNHWQDAKLNERQRAEFLICKALYFVLFVVPPFVILPPTWAVSAFIVFHLVLSWALALVFQMAHLTPGVDFNGVHSGDDWAMHQVRTTADFATGSRIATWLTGGLNHQIEHHLFPKVAHTHYSRLRPIVRAVAQRYGLECHDLGSFASALGQHFALLKNLGKRP